MRIINITSISIVILLLFSGVGYSVGWQPENCLLSARDQFTGGVIGNKIYVFGGNSPYGFGDIKSTEVFDPQTQLWKFRANNEHNNGRGVEELTGAVLNNKLYVFYSSNFNFVEEYDPITDTWTSKAPPLIRRSGSTAVVYNSEIYIFGGWGFSEDGNNRPMIYDVEAYNPDTNSWRLVTNTPNFGGNLAIAVVNDKAYVIGGIDLEQGFIEDVIAYDFQTGKWITSGFAPWPNPRVLNYASSAPIVNGRIYVIGGLECESAENCWLSDKVDIFDPVANSWSTGPFLKVPIFLQLSLVLNENIYVIGGEISSYDLNLFINRRITSAVWKLDLSPPIMGDINDDGKIGLHEAVHALQVMSGVKP